MAFSVSSLGDLNLCDYSLFVIQLDAFSLFANGFYAIKRKSA
jgi:hypothetical protein